MEWTGKVLSVGADYLTGQMNITLSINERSALQEIDSIKDCEKLSIKAVKYRAKRSLDANALLWLCLGRIAESMTPPADKWDIYLQMLKQYGKFTYICVKEHVVDAVKAQWRECEVVGDIEINGQKAVQMLCYFGSSTYNTKEFSVLLDGVISEMVQMKIQPPTSAEMRRALELWEKQHEKTV